MRALLLVSALVLFLGGCLDAVQNQTAPEGPMEDLPTSLVVEDTTFVLEASKTLNVSLSWVGSSGLPNYLYYEGPEDRRFTAFIEGWGDFRLMLAGEGLRVPLGAETIIDRRPLTGREEVRLAPAQSLLVSTKGVVMEVEADAGFRVIHEDPEGLVLRHSWDNGWTRETEAYGPLLPGMFEGSTVQENNESWVRVEATIMAKEYEVRFRLGDDEHLLTTENPRGAVFNGTGDLNVEALMVHHQEPFLVMWIMNLPWDPWSDSKR